MIFGLSKQYVAALKSCSSLKLPVIYEIQKQMNILQGEQLNLIK